MPVILHMPVIPVSKLNLANGQWAGQNLKITSSSLTMNRARAAAQNSAHCLKPLV